MKFFLYLSHVPFQQQLPAIKIFLSFFFELHTLAPFNLPNLCPISLPSLTFRSRSFSLPLKVKSLSRKETFLSRREISLSLSKGKTSLQGGGISYIPRKRFQIYVKATTFKYLHIPNFFIHRVFLFFVFFRVFFSCYV